MWQKLLLFGFCFYFQVYVENNCLLNFDGSSACKRPLIFQSEGTNGQFKMQLRCE